LEEAVLVERTEREQAVARAKEDAAKHAHETEMVELQKKMQEIKKTTKS